nr:DoxX family protein [uncultured Duganella sp.]
MSTSTLPAPGKYLSAGLWAAQTLVALVFIASGLTKLLTPIAQLVAMMAWTGEYPLAFVRGIGLVDIAGGLGILLPSLTRILPRLTVLAALCSVVLQVLAIGFHASRGEFEALPLNFVLLPLCLFVLWGRAKRAPIGPRGAARPHPG